MKKHIILFLLISFGSVEVISAQVPDWQWAVQSVGSTTYSYFTVLQICSDASGNMYVLGNADYGPFVDSGVLKSDSSYYYSNTFVAKFNGQGKAIWVRHVRDSSGSPHAGLALDSSGNCYIFALSRVIVDLGSERLLRPGAYIVKYDSSGDIRWGRNVSDQYIYASALAIDKQGNLYITGLYSVPTNFESVRLTDSAEESIYLAKLDTLGRIEWARSIEGTNPFSACEGTGLSIVDESGSTKIYLLGDLSSDSTYFDDKLVVNESHSTSSYCVFLARCNDQGKIEWVRTGNDSNHGSFNDGVGWGICSDPDGEIYITGNFAASAGFFDRPIYTNSNSNAFTAKFNPSGASEWIEVSSPTDPNNLHGASGCGIAVDPEGNVYTCGAYTGVINFGGETVGPDPWGNDNLFVLSYDGSGNKRWVRHSTTDRINAGIGTAGMSVMTLSGGSSYISGAYQNSFTLGNMTLLPVGGNGQAELYLTKLGSSGASVSDRLSSPHISFSIFPNPASAEMTLNFTLGQSADVGVEIIDMLGRSKKEISLGEMNEGNHAQEIDLSGLPSGSYICRMNTGANNSEAVVTIMK
jgi:hypothetical protein